MAEANRVISDSGDLGGIKNNKETHEEIGSNNISLLGKFDGQAIIQAVVMSELLGKPKAKRRKRGRF